KAFGGPLIKESLENRGKANQRPSDGAEYEQLGEASWVRARAKSEEAAKHGARQGAHHDARGLEQWRVHRHASDEAGQAPQQGPRKPGFQDADRVRPLTLGPLREMDQSGG